MGIEDSVEKILAAERERIWAEVRERQERLALVEQAEGVLMFVYGLDADGAFGVLKSLSQHHNVELRLVAEQSSRTWSSSPGRRRGPTGGLRSTASCSPRTTASLTSAPANATAKARPASR